MADSPHRNPNPQLQTLTGSNRSEPDPCPHPAADLHPAAAGEEEEESHSIRSKFRDLKKSQIADLAGGEAGELPQLYLHLLDCGKRLGSRRSPPAGEESACLDGVVVLAILSREDAVDVAITPIRGL
ncbi:uncharacterized protein A4U43_C03F12170 [Asparagus officinalis]|uniref:Uncharacterized protein n=1 Tax=Asparagus officinalis TaxID=4686 RepID=A0A5P1FEK4_ASPOF|nr:uncharacterized protein A4U43_C03F12170 [Asparagus officinalis]